MFRPIWHPIWHVICMLSDALSGIRSGILSGLELAFLMSHSNWGMFWFFCLALSLTDLFFGILPDTFSQLFIWDLSCSPRDLYSDTVNPTFCQSGTSGPTSPYNSESLSSPDSPMSAWLRKKTTTYHPLLCLFSTCFTPQVARQAIENPY